MTIYLRKNGGLWFWRIERLGGSFYVSAERWVDESARLVDRAIARQKRERARQAAIFWRRQYIAALGR